jgi:hypothetical protein
MFSHNNINALHSDNDQSPQIERVEESKIPLSLKLKIKQTSHFESFFNEEGFDFEGFQIAIINLLSENPTYSVIDLDHYYKKNYFGDKEIPINYGDFILLTQHLTAESLIQVLKRMPAKERAKAVNLEYIARTFKYVKSFKFASLLLSEHIVSARYVIEAHGICRSILDALASPSHIVNFLLELQSAGKA